MRATVFHGARDVRIEEVPDATLREPTDALVRVTHACICGSDLWPYRGELLIYGEKGRMGHEFMGVVEAVGAEVRTLKPGDRGDRSVRVLGRGLRVLQRRPPHLLRAGRLLGCGQRRRPGRGGARAARRRHPGEAARRGRPLRYAPRHGARDAHRRLRHRPPRRRELGDRTRRDRRGRRRRRGGPVRRARRGAPRGGPHHHHGPPRRAARRGPPLRRHRRGARARRGGDRPGARADRRRRAARPRVRRHPAGHSRPRSPSAGRGGPSATSGCRPSRSG